jgi:MoxR-like ATPase
MESAKVNKNGRVISVLRKGDVVVAVEGTHAGHIGLVIEPVAIPDGQQHQRKVVVTFEGDTHPIHILPRQLELAEVPAVPQQPLEATPMNNIDTPVAPSEASKQRTEVPTVETIKASDVQSLMHIDDPMHPALDPYRPNARLVEEYVSREVPGGYTDIEYLLNLRDDRDEEGGEARPNVALVGPTQAGKTMLMQVLAVKAAERDGMPKPYPLFTLNGSAGISNYDLFGKTTAVIIDGQEVLVWMDGVVPLALRCGGFLYLDEWNAVPPTQAVGLHSVLDDRRQFTNTHRAVPNGHGGWQPEIVKAHPNLWVVATINPLGYKGTQAMAEATSNRFRWMDWGYDTEVEKQILKAEAVRDFAHILRQEHDMGLLKTPVGTSALVRLNFDIATYGAETALWTFRSMFQTASDRLKVDELIESHDMENRLGSEYSTRIFEPAKKKK